MERRKSVPTMVGFGLTNTPVMNAKPVLTHKDAIGRSQEDV